jgi:hypothetical protein
MNPSLQDPQPPKRIVVWIRKCNPRPNHLELVRSFLSHYGRSAEDINSYRDHMHICWDYYIFDMDYLKFESPKTEDLIHEVYNTKVDQNGSLFVPPSMVLREWLMIW